MTKAKCIKQLPIFNLSIGDIKDIKIFTHPRTNEQTNVVVFNEVCYTQVGSDYFNEYFEIVEEE